MADWRRASDKDRERVVQLLGRNFSEGLLSPDTFELRVAASYNARQISELDGIVEDLPRRVPARLTRALKSYVTGPAQTSATGAPRLVLSLGPLDAGVLGPGRCLVGRSRECDYRIPDPTVSARHAEVFLQDDAWVVSDLGSVNGVFLNGRRTWKAALGAGDEVRLGHSTLVFDPRP